jgi:hypothetical protein
MLQVYYYEPDRRDIGVDEISFSADDPKAVAFVYNDANESVSEDAGGLRYGLHLPHPTDVAAVGTVTETGKTTAPFLPSMRKARWLWWR